MRNLVILVKHTVMRNPQKAFYRTTTNHVYFYRVTDKSNYYNYYLIVVVNNKLIN